MGENITSRFSASSRDTNLYTANPIQELHEQVLVRLQTTIRPVCVKHARPWSRKDASPIWEPLMFTVPFEE